LDLVMVVRSCPGLATDRMRVRDVLRSRALLVGSARGAETFHRSTSRSLSRVRCK
jgi:hypothetical protein